MLLARRRRRKECEELALVLHALGIPHAIDREDGEWGLVVPGDRAVRAARELELYTHENLGWPTPRRELAPSPPNAVPAAVLVPVLVMAVTALAWGRAFDRDWLERGGMYAARVLEGEWWRPVTSLTLHTDLQHLAGNAIFGAVFGLLAAQVLGTGLAWALILASGALGNALNIALRGAEHRAVGASTAVFGAIGLLVAYEWRRRGELRVGPLHRWAPPVLGLVLLGWLGMGGERTDVTAHLTGMLAGAVLGLLAGSLPLETAGRAGVQRLAGALAALLLALSWGLALR